MKFEAYNTWIDLYDEELSEIWTNEPEELKKLSMVLFVLKKQFKTIEESLETRVTNIRKTLGEKQTISDPKNCSEITRNGKVLSHDKENLQHKLIINYCETKQRDNLLSPELFKGTPPNVNYKPNNDIHTSPTINRCKLRKLNSSKRLKTVLSPSLLQVGSIEDKTELDGTIDIIKVKDDLSSTKTDFKTPDRKFDSAVRTPVNGIYEDVLDSTIIDSTPVLYTARKMRNKSGRGLNSKLELRKNTIQKDNLVSKPLQEKNKKKKDDIDLTCLEADDLPSSMEIDEILDYVEAISNGKGTGLPKQDALNSKITNKVNIKQNATSVQGTSKNSSGIDENITRIEQDLKISNSFVEDYDKIDKTQAPTKTEQPYKEVVRGKERQNLPGWSCDDCREYYERLNLPTEELQKKMDACSKHRSKYKIENTFAAFWDMGMPSTPPSQVTQEQSIVFQPDFM